MMANRDIAPRLEAMTAARGNTPHTSGRTGGGVYDFLSGGDTATGREQLDRAAAATALREAGIPGIRYLDGGSRAAGDGTRNYVMFDDSLIEILRKYGLAGLGLGLGANTFGGEQPQQ